MHSDLWCSSPVDVEAHLQKLGTGDVSGKEEGCERFEIESPADRILDATNSASSSRESAITLANSRSSCRAFSTRSFLLLSAHLRLQHSPMCHECRAPAH